MATGSTIFAHVAPLQQALDFHLERHSLLASNIAHVDTPRYKPVDLARAGDSRFHEELHLALTRTHETHLSPSAPEAHNGRIFQDLSAGGAADGNFVSLDREAGKLAANRLRYDVVSVLIKSTLDGLMTAAGDRQ